jgi:crotonobetainyl-CoA:carnitine CoA-transferase CaiB-like acyl-CoA transferase
MSTTGALAGIKVLDLSRMLPGPYCSMILADHGAEVIAIEDRRFQADGLFFSDLNRNKRHISLNLKDPRGLKIFFQLADQADVLIEGFRPGVVARLGIDYPRVSHRNPRIIYCSISGFGQNGPLRERVGHDVNYLSRAGVLELIGTAETGPLIPGVQIADIAGGSMNAAVGILLALYAREKSGAGQYIDISMTDGVVGLLSLPAFFAGRNGTAPRRGDEQLSHRYACYNVYRTADDRYLAIGAVEQRFWNNLCQALGRPDLTALQYDDERREEVIGVLRQIFLGRTLADWEESLADVDVCFTGVQSLAELADDPLLLEREMVCGYPEASGDERQAFGIPVKLSATPGTIRSAPGAFGHGTEAVLGELGYSAEEIALFFREGVV